MILEGIVTTLNEDGSPNISPMGPEVEPSFDRFVLKPYQTSTTYVNLKRTGEGVLHVTDDVELLARAAINRFDELPRLSPAEAVAGVILADACRWYAFRVTELNDQEQRTRIACEVVDQGRLRDFFGLNRGKHAVVEAAILSTRIKFLPADEIRAEFAKLRVLVDKTGGDAEHAAFDLLDVYVAAALAAAS
jgi:hypothetical protein